MRIAVLSDLHVEFQDFEPPTALRAADVVVLAGDIHNGVAALRWARARFPDQRIVQVAGNHEFFGSCWQVLIDGMRREAHALEIDFLENAATVIDGVQFLGATLWTDFELFSGPGRPLRLDAAAAKDRMQRRMVEYRLVRWQDGLQERQLTPDDTLQLHLSSRSWLEQRLAQPFAGPRVVITHHLPSWRSVAPSFLQAATNVAFASDLDSLFGSMALWIHGHTHYSFDYRDGASRIVANPRGYPLKSGADENPHFDPALIVTVGG